MILIDWHSLGAEEASYKANGSKVFLFDNLLTDAVWDVELISQAENLRLSPYEVQAAAAEYAKGWWSVYSSKRAAAAAQVLSAN
jgi:hypothetical protein